MDAVNIDTMLRRFAEHWSPKTIAPVNDYDVRIVKVQGEFTWHQHTDTDEFSWYSMGSSPSRCEIAMWCSGRGICSWCPAALSTACAPRPRPHCCYWSRAASSTAATQAAN